MLVVSRKKGQRVIVRIPASTEPMEMIIDISGVLRRGSGDVVRMALDAPMDIMIWREELVKSVDGGDRRSEEANQPCL